MRVSESRFIKGSLTPSDSVIVIVTLTGGTFDLFDGHCDGQNGLHTHFTHHYGDGDGIDWCEQSFRDKTGLVN